ncbi:porin [Aureibaculum sp. 2210JD6-5]|uniref:OprO/OprP family phosphate-selective porin n=1 Tax=Aureibaculum sp. 2210JD6-5 TaxID=3103957 RepID=UPI002AAE1F8C|nr:porin [Aureibaculum sp. 2210JD6-5]MDY7396508.1 porin [Aureibaculum sp. 2210JD6-5]
MNLKNVIAILVCTISFSVFAQEKEGNPFNFKWDNGFKVNSADENFEFKFGGRIMLDHAFFSQNEALNDVYGKLLTTSATEIRRARFFLSGVVYKNIEFKLDLGFEGGEVAFKDAYLGIKDIPVLGTIRIGNVKEPLRLEMLTSSKYITFLERSLLSDFSPTRNNGILAMNEFLEDRIGVQVGLFRNAGDDGNDIMANDGYVFTSRISGLPLKNRKQLLHLGLGYSFRKPNSTNSYRISSRPEAHLSNKKYIDTELIENVNNLNMLNFETAFVTGPLSLQAEYLITDLKADENYNFSSYYGQVSYFLTGEQKKYKSSYSGFDRVKPKQNFMGKDGGAGAWEIALRYSNSDLNSKDIFGGEQSDITLGINWYLNPVTKIALNHVWGNIKDAGNVSVFQARFQIDF